MITPRTTNKPPGFTKHPSQNYIKFLLLTKANVIDFLKKYELPEVSNTYLENLKKGMADQPNDFDPTNRYHAPSLAFIKAQEIYNLFFPDTYTKEAFKYLSDLEVRNHIETLLISRTKPLEIAKAINAKLETLCTEEGIDRYRHYFWNTKIMKIEDWSKVLESPSEKSRIKRLYKGGPSYAKFQLGGFLQKIEAKQLLSDILIGLKYDVEELKFTHPTPDKIKSLSMIVGMIGDIDDRLSSMDLTMKDTLKQFAKFKVDHAKANIKSINESAALGNYSGSGINLPELATEAPKMLASDGYTIIDIKETQEEDE